MKKSYFRFYGQLNDFLPPEKRQKTIPYSYWGNPTIQDACAAQGVPHPEIFFVLQGSQPVNLKDNLRGEERISVYPRWTNLELPSKWQQHPGFPAYPLFAAADHLGKLARLMRILGFDVVFKGEGEEEGRIILTRKLPDLKMNRISLGYMPRSDEPYSQLEEVLDYFNLREKIKPLSRCPGCNSGLKPVAAEKIWDRLEPKTKKYYRKFKLCPSCDKIYWRGSHFRRLQKKLGNIVPSEEGDKTVEEKNT